MTYKTVLFEVTKFLPVCYMALKSHTTLKVHFLLSTKFTVGAVDDGGVDRHRRVPQTNWPGGPPREPREKSGNMSREERGFIPARDPPPVPSDHKKLVSLL